MREHYHGPQDLQAISEEAADSSNGGLPLMKLENVTHRQRQFIDAGLLEKDKKNKRRSSGGGGGGWGFQDALKKMKERGERTTNDMSRSLHNTSIHGGSISSHRSKTTSPVPGSSWGSNSNRRRNLSDGIPNLLEESDEEEEGLVRPPEEDELREKQQPKLWNAIVNATQDMATKLSDRHTEAPEQTNNSNNSSSNNNNTPFWKKMLNTQKSSDDDDDSSEYESDSDESSSSGSSQEAKGWVGKEQQETGNKFTRWLQARRGGGDGNNSSPDKKKKAAAMAARRESSQGSLVRRDSQGSLVRRDSQGSLVRRDSQGSLVRRNSNGSFRRDSDPSFHRDSDGSLRRDSPASHRSNIQPDRPQPAASNKQQLQPERDHLPRPTAAAASRLRANRLRESSTLNNSRNHHHHQEQQQQEVPLEQQDQQEPSNGRQSSLSVEDLMVQNQIEQVQQFDRHQHRQRRQQDHNDNRQQQHQFDEDEDDDENDESNAGMLGQFMAAHTKGVGGGGSGNIGDKDMDDMSMADMSYSTSKTGQDPRQFLQRMDSSWSHNKEQLAPEEVETKERRPWRRQSELRRGSALGAMSGNATLAAAAAVAQWSKMQDDESDSDEGPAPGGVGRTGAGGLLGAYLEDSEDDEESLYAIPQQARTATMFDNQSVGFDAVWKDGNASVATMDYSHANASAATEKHTNRGPAVVGRSVNPQAAQLIQRFQARSFADVVDAAVDARIREQKMQKQGSDSSKGKTKNKKKKENSPSESDDEESLKTSRTKSKKKKKKSGSVVSSVTSNEGKKKKKKKKCEEEEFNDSFTQITMRSTASRRSAFPDDDSDDKKKMKKKKKKKAEDDERTFRTIDTSTSKKKKKKKPKNRVSSSDDDDDVDNDELHLKHRKKNKKGAESVVESVSETKRTKKKKKKKSRYDEEDDDDDDDSAHFLPQGFLDSKSSKSVKSKASKTGKSKKSVDLDDTERHANTRLAWLEEKSKASTMTSLFEQKPMVDDKKVSLSAKGSSMLIRMNSSRFTSPPSTSTSSTKDTSASSLESSEQLHQRVNGEKSNPRRGKRLFGLGRKPSHEILVDDEVANASLIKGDNAPSTKMERSGAGRIRRRFSGGHYERTKTSSASEDHEPRRHSSHGVKSSSSSVKSSKNSSRKPKSQFEKKRSKTPDPSMLRKFNQNNALSRSDHGIRRTQTYDDSTTPKKKKTSSTKKKKSPMVRSKTPHTEIEVMALQSLKADDGKKNRKKKR